MFLGVGGNLFVLGSAQANITDIDALVAEALRDCVRQEQAAGLDKPEAEA